MHHFGDEQRVLWGMFAKWLALGTLVGLLAGSAAAIFLLALDVATNFRVANPLIVWALPVAGLVLGWVYARYGGVAARGNNLIFEEVNQTTVKTDIPVYMTPLILCATVWTHLFGGSAGREGAAAQMGASLADGLRRLLRLNDHDRRLMVMAGISGGFGGVFGTPLAGFVFGMEAQTAGQIRYEGVLPCLTAAIVGDWVAQHLWGIHHSAYPLLPTTPLELGLVVKVLIAGVVFGLTGLLFIELLHLVKGLCKRSGLAPSWYPALGGAAILALMGVSGTQDYLGLSLPLLKQALHGEALLSLAFLLKLIFTALTLGTGFVGGEVTPLFVIGATLGAVLGRLLGIEPTFLAALGMAAVFAGASNTPLACAVMGVELFGGGAVLYLGLACFVAYLVCGHRSIYGRQRLATVKSYGYTAKLHAPIDEL